LSRPSSRFSSGPQIRINGKIRAREVRVIDADGTQLGVLSLHEAIRAAQSRGVDLVEVAPTATPPVCRLEDYGRYLYRKAKEDKKTRGHQHASKVKEVQLSPSIDPHDFGIKLKHAVDFLSEEMKVKVVLKFRGREMAHKEIGFQVVQKLIKDVEAYGQPDAVPKLTGRNIVLMLSPLPRNKRGKPAPAPGEAGAPTDLPAGQPVAKPQVARTPPPEHYRPTTPPTGTSGAFANNPFASLDLKVGSEAPADEASGA
jgi:translation initiation factor IF-3